MLAGVSGDAVDLSCVASFVQQLTGFPPAALNREPTPGAVRALIVGRGAFRAAAAVAGKRCDADRQFEKLQMHVEWFCPCGASGVEPLTAIDVCPACGSGKPPSLAEAAEAAEKVAVERRSQLGPRAPPAVPPAAPLWRPAIPSIGAIEKIFGT